MKKLIVQIDENLHRDIKLLAFTYGVTMKMLVTQWLEEKRDLCIKYEKETYDGKGKNS